MSDTPAFTVLTVLVFSIACLLGFIAGNAIGLERGLDVPDAVELD